MQAMIARIAVTTANSLLKLSLTKRMTKNTARRPSVRLTPRKTSVPTMLSASAIGSTSPAAAREKMIETMIQPIESSITAEARIAWPAGRRGGGGARAGGAAGGAGAGGGAGPGGGAGAGRGL